jgi:hypothetical protein
MENHRKIAIIVGVLFIIGSASGVVSGVLSAPLLTVPDYLGAIAANQSSFITAAIFVLTMGLSLVMVPVMLYPIFKKYNQALALGAVVFRGTLEGVLYLLIILCWFSLLTLSQAPQSNAATAQFLADQVKQVEVWVIILQGIAFSLGALMIYYLFIISRLIPRWLSLWGFIGAILYIVAPFIVMFDVQNLALSLDGSMGFLMGPLALQEMVFALWLIIKGFNKNPVPVK